MLSLKDFGEDSSKFDDDTSRFEERFVGEFGEDIFSDELNLERRLAFNRSGVDAKLGLGLHSWRLAIVDIIEISCISRESGLIFDESAPDVGWKSGVSWGSFGLSGAAVNTEIGGIQRLN